MKYKNTGKMSFCSDFESLFELTTRVYLEEPLHKSDIIYVFGQSVNHQQSNLKRAIELYGRGLAPRIGIADFQKLQGYAGLEALRSALIHKKVPKSRIIAVQPALSDFPPSTDAEATGLVRLAHKMGWQRLIITSPPIHQFRAFISTISAAKREGLKLKIYNSAGLPLKWCEHAVHSQGIEKGLRKDLLRSGEWSRLSCYHAKGDLISAAEALEYLNHRDVR